VDEIDVVEGSAEDTVIDTDILDMDTDGVEVARLRVTEVCALEDDDGAMLLPNGVVDTTALLDEDVGWTATLLLEMTALELDELGEDAVDDGVLGDI
jgi:hypothetical protein